MPGGQRKLGIWELDREKSQLRPVCVALGPQRGVLLWVGVVESGQWDGLSWILPKSPRLSAVNFLIGHHESESETCSVVSDSLWPHGLYSPWNSPGQNIGMCRLSLLQGIFQTQGLNPGLLHCRQILYQLSHRGSPRTLEWIAYPFSSGSSWPRNRTGVFTAGGFFTNWAIKCIKLAKQNCS